MSGRILRDLIDDERAGKYLGKTVQVVPHFTEALEKQVLLASRNFDIHIVEIGGTVGDYESPAFFEAIRSLGSKLGHSRVCYVHVVYLPFLDVSKEIKTKPAQNATRDLRALGIMPDVLIGRSRKASGKETKDKLAKMTGINRHGIALVPDADTIYRVPSVLHEAGVDTYILNKLEMPKRTADLSQWNKLLKLTTQKPDKRYKVALVAKYMANEDTYYSVTEAVNSAAWHAKKGVEVIWVNAEKLNKNNVHSKLKQFDGIIVPGGFGSRGIEGKVIAATYAIKKKVPYLGLCLGLQVGVIAYAREILGIETANSIEVDPDTKDPVIFVMKDQVNQWGTGGTMRLGSYKCDIKPGTLTRKIYGQAVTYERHRHRYEVNNDYKARLEKRGLIFSGIWTDGNLAEIIEINDHPFFIASQFHPELRSRPMRPHPMFKGFVGALQKR